MAYLLSYGLSVLFAWLANRSTNKAKVIFWSLLSISVTVLLAGLRDYSIGIDTENYLTLKIYWGGASTADSLKSYLEFYAQNEKEYLFAFLVGSIAQFTGNFRIYLFACHLVIVGGVYIGAYRLRKYANPALVMLIFYFMCFGSSLNIMRQYMAMAILFAVLADIFDKKYLRYTIVVSIAMLIHTTAIIGFVPLFIYLYLKQHRCQRAPQFRKYSLLAIELLVVVMFAPIARSLMSLGLGQYNFFLNPDESEPAIVISLVVLLGLLAVWIFKDAFKRNIEHADFFIICSVAFFIILQITWFVVYGKRVALYLAFIFMITVAALPRSLQKRSNRQLVTAGIVLSVFAYWLYVYILNNGSHTYPYILGV